MESNNDNIAEFHHKTDPYYAQLIVEGLIDRLRSLHYQLSKPPKMIEECLRLL